MSLARIVAALVERGEEDLAEELVSIAASQKKVHVNPRKLNTRRLDELGLDYVTIEGRTSSGHEWSASKNRRGQWVVYEGQESTPDLMTTRNVMALVNEAKDAWVTYLTKDADKIVPVMEKMGIAAAAPTKNWEKEVARACDALATGAKRMEQEAKAGDLDKIRAELGGILTVLSNVLQNVGSSRAAALKKLASDVKTDWVASKY